MAGTLDGHGGLGPADPDGVQTIDDLARLLRRLRRRDARARGGVELTYRELAARTGWSHAAVGQYLTGRALPPTDRFDTLVRLLGATPAEREALASARDRVGERRRAPRWARPVAVVPRQLPPAARDFTGRAAHLAALTAWAAGSVGRAVSGAGTTTLAVVTGAAGVGTTELAIQWAHREVDRFPDGQLYLNLRGHGPDRPVAPDDALATLLCSLGVPGAQVPTGLDARAGRYRSEIADRRMLLVLDNASSAEQVRPLLPATPSCVVLVTSRDTMPGLVARHGAYRIELDPLPRALRTVAEQAIARSHRTSGPARLTDREREVAELAAQGLTSQEIAVRLFVSTRTVDSHLSHVFAKLDVRSRVAMAHRLRLAS
jgi:DNA-binding CsgD family transcriptional regulator/transcriptional regulator with XRE-family HTH domain